MFIRFISAIREHLDDLAPYPLAAIINAAQTAVTFLAAAYLLGQTASYNGESDINEFLALFYLVILLAGIAVTVLELGSHHLKRRLDRRARERLYERLRSRGHTPERAATLVGICQALASASYTWRQSTALARGVPTDGDIAEAMLRRMPAPDACAGIRRRFPNLCAHIASGALIGLTLVVAFDLTILAFAPDYPFLDTEILVAKSGLLAFSGAIYGLRRWRKIRRRDNLRRELERCNSAGLDAGSAALLLTQTPALIRSDKKAAVALSAAS